jgi:hypothetical protein
MAGATPGPGSVFKHLTTLLHSCHHPSTTALIFPSFAELEPEAIEPLTQAVKKPVHMVGMQFPESTWKGEEQEIEFTNEDDLRVMSFLDKMQKEYGENSVIYVRYVYPVTTGIPY